MKYGDFPLDVKKLLESIDESLQENDDLKTYLFITSYGKMIHSINRSLYFDIVLSYISKFINNDDVCVKLANNTISINKKLLELNKYLLKAIKQLEDESSEKSKELLTLIKNFWLITYYEMDCGLTNIPRERTYYYDKNKNQIEELFKQNEELKLSIK